MAQLIVRKLDDALVQALKIRAAEKGRSAEEEHRRILQEALEKVSAPMPLMDYLMLHAEETPDFPAILEEIAANRGPGREVDLGLDD